MNCLPRTLTILALATAAGLTVGVDATSAEPAVDALFAEYDRPDAPGCALGVIRDGAFVYRRGYGQANLEYGLPITSRSVFRTGSVGKQFTAAAVALLAESGSLDLDDPVSRFFPEFPDWAERMSVRQLVLHTSGIRDYLELAFLSGKSDDADYYTDQWVLDLLARQRETNFPPGTEYLYSNSGYLLLAHIVKRVSGQSLRDFAAARIFGPLGMKDSHFHDDHREIVPRRASGYAPADAGFRISMTTLDLVGDGGVFTTIDDLLLWDRNFYDNRLGGGAAFIERLTTPGRLNDGETLDYAFGLGVQEHRGLRLVEHGGSFVGYRAASVRFPDERLSTFVLCNRSDAPAPELALKAAEHYLADRLGPPPGPEETDAAAARKPAPKGRQGNDGRAVADYAGRYYSEELDVTYVLRPEGAGLRLQVPGQPEQALEAGPADTFENPDYGSFAFLRGPDGAVSGFRLQAGRVRNLAFIRR